MASQHYFAIRCVDFCRVAMTAALALFAAQERPARAADAPGLEFFEKKVRPVLVEHCYQCHSVEAQKAKKLRGGLLLDSRAGVRNGGDSGPVVVSGKPAASLLIQAVRHEGLKMPPKGKLPEPVIADLAKWIEIGAPDPREASPLKAKRVIDLDAGRKHWAFQPLARVSPPTVRNLAWPRTPVDRFILAGLEEKHLAPNPAVSREKLIRRAYFDLVGLPPPAEEIEAFLKDPAAGAYERLIDRLLQNERYGERWARHWLDVVRFAESGGYEFDGDRPGAYFYRDFVIKALNQDMPFDEFVRWQVAGDQLQPGDLLATSATGFLVAGPYPGQITAKTATLIRYDHLDDMIATLGTSLLGLSLGCARCHEHKYDPIPQQDYYHLVSCLSRTDSTQAKLDPHPADYLKAKAAFDKTHAPLAAARDRFAKEELPGRVQKWLQAEKENPPPEWLVLDADRATQPALLKKLPDGSLLAEGKAAKTDTYTIVAQTRQKGITAIRLEALADPSLPQAGPGRSPAGGFSLTEFSVTAAPLAAPGKPAKAEPVKLQTVAATFEQPSGPLAGALDNDKKTGWSVVSPGKSQAAIFETKTPIGFEGGTVLTMTLKFENDGFAIGRPRLAFTTGRPARLDGQAALQNAWELRTVLKEQEGKLNAKNLESVVRWFRALDPKTEQVQGAVEQHAVREPKPNLLPVFSAQSGRGGEVHYLIRGEVERTNGVARPAFLQVLMSAPDKEKHWLSSAVAGTKPAAGVEPRVALGKWLTDPEDGAGRLLARVIVNRLWQHHLGKGLVRTPNDFGVQGEPPTHPGLLDYLAAELIRNGWKLKPIHKLIATSAVYMQNGDMNAAGMQEDPQNRLWWRVAPRRLEAESIRDALLAVGGTLDPTMYGPGTLDETSPRRSIYLTVKRSRLIPLMQAFDSPEPIQGVGERQTTTVATQALALMNSPFVRRQAETLARRIQPQTPVALPQAVDRAYLLALGRRATPGERERMADFIRCQPNFAAALADSCQVLLCLNEFVYVE